MTIKVYKVNFTLLFSKPTDIGSSDTVSNINQLFLDIDKSISIVYEPLNETDFVATALMVLDVDQQSPEYWVPLWIHHRLRDNVAMTEFNSIEVLSDQVETEKNVILNKILRMNAAKEI
jgi:hypothetical protein